MRWKRNQDIYDSYFSIEFGNNIEILKLSLLMEKTVDFLDFPKLEFPLLSKQTIDQNVSKWIKTCIF